MNIFIPPLMPKKQHKPHKIMHVEVRNTKCSYSEK